MLECKDCNSCKDCGRDRGRDDIQSSRQANGTVLILRCTSTLPQEEAIVSSDNIYYHHLTSIFYHKVESYTRKSIVAVKVQPDDGAAPYHVLMHKTIVHVVTFLRHHLHIISHSQKAD